MTGLRSLRTPVCACLQQSLHHLRSAQVDMHRGTVRAAQEDAGHELGTQDLKSGGHGHAEQLVEEQGVGG